MHAQEARLLNQPKTQRHDQTPDPYPAFGIDLNFELCHLSLRFLLCVSGLTLSHSLFSDFYPESLLSLAALLARRSASRFSIRGIDWRR